MTTHRRLGTILLAIAVLTVGCVNAPTGGGDLGEGDTETIEHSLGNTTIESTPQRVVALEWTYAEALLALGIQPVGVADKDGYERWVKAEPALNDSVADVGTRQEPSLEQIAGLEPDLIIGVEFRHEQIHDRLSEIAPTLVFNPYPPQEGPDQYGEMTQTFRTIADAVDREESAEQVLSDLDATYERARQDIEQAGAAGQPIVLAQAFTQEGSPTLRLFTDNAMAIAILEQVGLENAWTEGFETYGFSTVGLEALQRVEHASFLYVAQPDDDPVNQTWSEDPTWRNLTFVQEDRVHPLGGDVWLFGGPLSAEYLVDATVDRLVRSGGG